MQANTEQRNEI